MQPYLGKEANVWEAALALLAETNEAPQKDHVAEILHHNPVDPTQAWVCFALWFVRPQSAEASWFVALLFHKDAAIQRQAVDIFSTHPRHLWLPVLEQWIIWARHHSEKKALHDRTITSVVPLNAQQNEAFKHDPPTLLPPTSFDFSVATIRRVARILRRMRVQCSLLDIPLQRAQDEMDQALFSD
ncbi:hypothetical protein L6R29_02065 [Myxococcota bacterium]|nr:hypothetical protein [Myxococcota bacterium]